MKRILASAALLTLSTASLVDADIFKCQQPDGTIVFTDNPSAADCKPERVKELPILSILPEPSPQPRPTPNPKAGEVLQAREKGQKSYETYMSEVSALVEEYQSVRKTVYHSSLERDIQTARRDLTDIKAHLSRLAGEIEQSSLSPSEKKELLEKLAVAGE